MAVTELTSIASCMSSLPLVMFSPTLWYPLSISRKKLGPFAHARTGNNIKVTSTINLKKR
jgi:hypothetical protein